MEPVRSNVEVMTYSLVSKVILDDANTAIGVEVERFGHAYQYFSSNEVILSAGAIGSAQGFDSMKGRFGGLKTIVQTCTFYFIIHC